MPQPAKPCGQCERYRRPGSDECPSVATSWVGPGVPSITYGWCVTHKQHVHHNHGEPVAGCFVSRDAARREAELDASYLPGERPS